MAAVFEAVQHTSTHQGGRRQQGEGEEAGAQQMHRQTTAVNNATIVGATCPVAHLCGWRNSMWCGWMVWLICNRALQLRYNRVKCNGSWADALYAKLQQLMVNLLAGRLTHLRPQCMRVQPCIPAQASVRLCTCSSISHESTPTWYIMLYNTAAFPIRISNNNISN